MVCSVCLKYLWKVKDKRESSNLENCLQEMNSSLQKKGERPHTGPERYLWPFSWSISCLRKSHQKWSQWKGGSQEVTFKEGKQGEKPEECQIMQEQDLKSVPSWINVYSPKWFGKQLLCVIGCREIHSGVPKSFCDCFGCWQIASWCPNFGSKFQRTFNVLCFSFVLYFTTDQFP